MKTKVCFLLFFVYSSLNFAQKKAVVSKEDQKFYFPASSFSNEKEYDKNLNNLLAKLAPMEIDEKNQKFSDDADSFYLLQKNYKGIVEYSKSEKYPKEDLPIKAFAEAMIADPTQ